MAYFTAGKPVGKLYLNYSKDVQGLWLKHTSGNITKADKNWVEQAKKP